VNVNQFDYHLPPELIAQTPLEPRHASRLMVVNRQTGQITHRQFTDLVDLLHPGDILIANDSRVIPARLVGHKTSGGKVEILLLKQIDDLRWEVLVGANGCDLGLWLKSPTKKQRSKSAISPRPPVPLLSSP
jgi:S-adenosylmethionine:tRNA ribosyltransferase-isomerase